MSKIDNLRLEVSDILDKMQFFQGQRAGRELWNEKPFNIQEQDLCNFNRGITTIRDYIWDLEDKANADGCKGCAFESLNEWEMPCAKCKRNCKDYWRAKVGNEDDRD